MTGKIVGQRSRAHTHAHAHAHTHTHTAAGMPSLVSHITPRSRGTDRAPDEEDANQEEHKYEGQHQQNINGGVVTIVTVPKVQRKAIALQALPAEDASGPLNALVVHPSEAAGQVAPGGYGQERWRWWR